MRRVWITKERLHSEEQKRGRAPGTTTEGQTAEKYSETERQQSTLRTTYSSSLSSPGGRGRKSFHLKISQGDFIIDWQT
jgi:hypothetical protein